MLYDLGSRSFLCGYVCVCVVGVSLPPEGAEVRLARGLEHRVVTWCVCARMCVRVCVCARVRVC